LTAGNATAEHPSGSLDRLNLDRLNLDRLNLDGLKKRPGKASSRIRARAQHKQTPARKKTAHKKAPDRAVFLVGFMGAGKSSVGRALGQRLNWLFEDLDDRIERREGRKIAEIFRDSGEAHFRRAEHDALKQVLEELRGGAARIIALGGGAFVQDENAALLVAAGVPTIFLDAPVKELWRRCCSQAEKIGLDRPLLESFEQFRALHQSRRKRYLKAAMKVATEGSEVEAIADEIAGKLGLKKIAIRTQQGEAE
jgi:shikimate kinase